MNDLSALQKADLLRQLSRQDERIAKLEALLSGQAIRGVKIDQLSWDKAYGGTAVLGGQNNQAGQLEVRDESNNAAVVVNKDGVLINDGKITVKNNDGISTLDSFGLVSSSNFNNGSNTSVGAGVSITSLSFSDLSGSPIPFTVPRSTLAFLVVTCSFFMSQSPVAAGGWTVSGVTFIDIDGSTKGIGVEFGTEVTAGGVPSGAIRMTTGTDHALVPISAGDHIAKLKSKLYSTTNGGYMFMWSYHLSLVLLGT